MLEGRTPAISKCGYFEGLRWEATELDDSSLDKKVFNRHSLRDSVDTEKACSNRGRKREGKSKAF